MIDRSQVQDAIGAGGGLLRLEPAWVPRTFMHPGRRLRLHPDDLYALGAHRGGINERWFSSTTNADNGPGTPADEGLSYVRLESGKRFLLKEAVETAGDLLLGSTVMSREGGWNLLCKFFDNMGPIPHHMHQSDAQAKLVGRKGKPEAYYFPPQYNQLDNNFPYTFMGLEPGTTKDDVRALSGELEQGRQRHPVSVARVQAAAGDRLADRSRHPSCARLARHLRAASSAATCSRCSSRLSKAVPSTAALLIKDVPAEKHNDLDFLVGLLDWDANVDHEFAKHNRVFPIPCAAV